MIVAGAGSGKTTTLMGKVNYVINRYNTPVEEILLISFTDKSASTIAQRINIDGVEAKTFHKFGLDVITGVEGVKPSIFDTNQFKGLLSRFLKQEGTLYDNLTKNLFDHGVGLKPKSHEEIWKIISTNSEDEVKSFIDLLATFITLTKSNNYTFNDISEKNKTNKEIFIYERNQVFIQIAKPIFDRYQKVDKNELVYTPLVIQATM